MAAKAKTEIVEIKPLDIQHITVKIVGDSPLIMHAWAAKAKREILQKELNLTKTKAREEKSPLDDFASSMYWLTPMPEEITNESIGEALNNGARFGFPVTAFKQASISAAYRSGWTKDKMSLRGVMFIEPDANGYYGGDLEISFDKKRIDIIPNQFKSEPMVEIHSDPPVMVEHMVKVGMGAADIRYRGEFRNWWASLKLSFNANAGYTVEQLVNIINIGGYVCGVGEWRPERDGQNGMYHVSVD